MDFNKLLEPYTENGRTIGGQIKWLAKNGIPQESIDYAISAVYGRISNGEVFAEGHDLDRELLKTGQEHHSMQLQQQMEKRIGEISNNLDVEWNKLTKWQKVLQVIQGKA
jgi:hypothetical protein